MTLAVGVSAAFARVAAPEPRVEQADLAAQLFADSCLRWPMQEDKIAAWAKANGFELFVSDGAPRWVVQAWRRSETPGQLLLLGEKKRCSVVVHRADTSRAIANFMKFLQSTPGKDDVAVRPLADRQIDSGGEQYRLIAYVIAPKDSPTGLYWSVTVTESESASVQVEYESSPVSLRP